MRKFNAICPVCGRMNRQLYLEETYGSFECEDCGTVSVRPAYSLVGEPEKQPDKTNVIASGTRERMTKRCGRLVDSLPHERFH